MKPSSLLRLRNVWIATCWLRNEAVAAAAMVIRHRDSDETDDRVGGDQKIEAQAGQVGVDGRGKLRIVRVMDDYIVPAECGLWATESKGVKLKKSKFSFQNKRKKQKKKKNLYY